MIPALFDTHCHLGHDELAPVSQDLVQRALEQGVRGFGLISADEKSLDEVFRQRDFLIQHFAHEKLHIAVSAGIHPHDADHLDDKLWQKVRKAAPAAEAIGETGLDYFYDHSDRDTQKKAFRQHIELAIEFNKPLVIHCRNAATDVLSLLKSYEADFAKMDSPGILHCFTEDQNMASQLLDLNFYISFSGIVTFKNAESLRSVLKTVPLEKLLIETDSPWLAPVPHRGQQNEPAFVRDLFDFVALTLNLEPTELKSQLWRNSMKVFFKT